MLSLEYCRNRQARLLAFMEKSGIAVAVLANPKTIYYFTGALVDAARPQAFVLADSGKSLLVTNRPPAQAAAERIVTYTAYTLDRVFDRTTMTEELAAAAREFLGGRAPGTAALESEYIPAALGELVKGINLTPALAEMRRRKDPDEIESIRAAAALTEAGYRGIRGRLEPGMTEYEAYLAVQEAMVRQLGTSVELEGDFACGARAINGGGAPTGRKVAAGDLYILDLFPTYEGYRCDLCRTFAAGRASALQQEAWAHVMAGHELAQRLIRPGAAARDVFAALREHLDQFGPCRGSFNHHAGHGIGLEAWEYPWITPGSQQAIQEGEVIAIEPGLYGECLQGGIRLEHNYLVGADGVSALDTFPMEL